MSKRKAHDMPDNLKELMNMPILGALIGGAVLAITRILADPKASKWARILLEVPTLWALGYMSWRASFGLCEWLGLPSELSVTIAFAVCLTSGHFGTNWIREYGQRWTKKYLGIED